MTIDAKQLQEIPHGQRKAYIDRLAKTNGVSANTIYRQLKRQRGKMKKVKREKEINRQYIDLIAQLKAKGLSFSTADRELSTEICIEILEQSGKLPKGLLNASTVNRRLKDEIGFRDKKPVVRYEADYANQCQQLDFSRSKYFELLDYDREKADYILICNARSYVSKKDDGKKLRLWVAMLVDEYSRARIVRYYAAAGENTLMGLEFLQHCWGREKDGHPLHYPPEYVKSDNGSFMKSQEAQTLMEALKIQWLPITPSNSKSLGKTERRWRTLFQGWELKTALLTGDKETIYLSELNERVHAAMIAELDKQHPRRKKYSIGHLYKTSMIQHPPREIDLDTMRLAMRAYERTVNADNTIRIDNELLAVPAEYKEQKIRVYRNIDGDYIGESIDDKSIRFPITPHKDQGFLQYKSYPYSAVETAEKDFDKSELANEIRTINNQQPTTNNQQPNNILTMPHKTRPDKPDTPFTKPDAVRAFKSKSSAREHIGRQLQTSYNDVAEIFDPVLAKTLDQDIIDGVIAECRKQRIAI